MNCPFRRRERGNFMILSAFFIILLVMLFFFVQDALTKSNLEQALQKLADDTALHAASYVPSVSAASYIQSTGELRPWMQEQNYAVGYHVLSEMDANAVDAYAAKAARDYVQRNAGNSAAADFFGGYLTINRVSPKFVARQEGNKEIIEYYVEVELGTRWASGTMSRDEDLTASAIARAVVEHTAFYSVSNPDYENPDPIAMFAKGVYARGRVYFNNVQGGGLTIIGDVHSDEDDAEFVNNRSGTGVYIDGDVEGYGSVRYTNNSPLAVSGTTRQGAAQVTQIHASMPPYPTGTDDPNYPKPIIIIDGDYTVHGTFPPAGLLDSEGNQATSGTLYVRNGTLHIGPEADEGSDPNITGAWCLVTDEDLHFNNLRNGIASDTGNDVFFMVGGSLHLNNVRGPALIHGAIYCDGDIHTNNFKNAEDYPFTVYGGIFANGTIHFNNFKNGVTIISEPMPDAMPVPWIVFPETLSSPPQYSSPVVTLIH